MDSGKIVREVNLNLIGIVYDIVVWNENVDCFLFNYLILACKDANSILVLNFEDLKVVSQVKVKEGYPVNLFKVLLKESNNQYKEGLISCQHGDGSPMRLYELFKV